MTELKNRPIEKIIKDFKELEFTNILGAIESGDVEEKDFAQIDKDLKELALFAESKLNQPTEVSELHKEFMACEVISRGGRYVAVPYGLAQKIEQALTIKG